MTTLRVIAEDAIARTSGRARPGGLARYSSELAKALIETAPPGCDVDLVFAAHAKPQISELTTRFPGTRRIEAAPLPRGALAAGWAAGAKLSIGEGILHSPSLFAPLMKHDRAVVTQVVVTIHDTTAWTHPASLGTAEAAWTRRMAQRAARYADAVVVPTHAVAAELAERLKFGERIRVVPGAVGTELVLPPEPEVRASWLKLPERFVLAAGASDPRTGIDDLVHAATLPDFGEVPLLIVADDESGRRHISEAAMLAGLPEGRVRTLGDVSDSDLALLLSRACVFVAPGPAEGSGASTLEALAFGTPLVHSDAPALVEVAGGAGLAVARDEPGSTYAERLASTVGSIVSGEVDAAKLGVLGRDRAKAFTWRAAGAQTWQLHAEL